jgi:hypothetical protein
MYKATIVCKSLPRIADLVIETFQRKKSTMKHRNILVATALAIGLMEPMTVYGADCIPTVTPETVENITYITGGIGICEASMMRSLAGDYALDVIFIQKLSKQEEFLADVKVQIKDRYRHLLLDISTEGPYLFVELPQGKYLIVAEYNSDIKQQWVHVGSVKGRKVVFWWPILPMPQ